MQRERKRRAKRIAFVERSSFFRFYARGIDAENDNREASPFPPSVEPKGFARGLRSTPGRDVEISSYKRIPSREFAIVPILFLSELFSRCARDIGTRTASVGRNIFFLIIFFFFGIRTIWNFVSVYYDKIVKEDRFYTGGWLILLHCNCFTREKNKTLKSFMHFVWKEI